MLNILGTEQCFKAWELKQPQNKLEQILASNSLRKYHFHCCYFKLFFSFAEASKSYPGISTQQTTKQSFLDVKCNEFAGPHFKILQGTLYEGRASKTGPKLEDLNCFISSEIKRRQLFGMRMILLTERDFGMLCQGLSWPFLHLSDVILQSWPFGPLCSFIWTLNKAKWPKRCPIDRQTKRFLGEENWTLMLKWWVPLHISYSAYIFN